MTGIIYRPPNQNTAAFVDKLNDILAIITKGNKQCYIMGDFNLDLLQYNNNVICEEHFVNRLFSFAFCRLISKPTRITFHTATLIDNIFTNDLTGNVFNGIVLNDLSDHMPIFACFHKELTPYCQEKVFKRSFNESNMNKFRQYLSEINWCTKLNSTDVNNSYNIFLNEYVNLFETCFPIEIIKPKYFENHNPFWMTTGLLRC